MTGQETVYGLSSGAGRAGIAVVRVTGSRSAAAIESLCGDLPEARRASLRRVRHPYSRSVIDEGLVLWLPGPHSFTGEDMAEFHVHGGRAVVAAILDSLGLLGGLRPAEAGEFTRRAFLNGRLDLVAVEGLADLIAAETEVQRRLAHFHYAGGASGVLEGWRREMIAVLSRIEAAIDFIDEDGVAETALIEVEGRIKQLHDTIALHLHDARRGERIREGVRVVLAGPPNVGKSSLLNRLARRDVAIVSAIPGTTRDVIEAHLDLGGVPVVVSDTAGLRDGTADEIETEGMTRTRARMAEADLVVWLSSPDAGCTMPRGIDSRALWILNKADLLKGHEAPSGPELLVSARSGAGVDRLVERMAAWARDSFSSADSALITRDRQRRALEACCSHLEAAAAHRGLGLELVAEEVRLAARELARLVGRIDVEDVLDAIFRDFCIGK